MKKTIIIAFPLIFLSGQLLAQQTPQVGMSPSFKEKSEKFKQLPPERQQKVLSEIRDPIVRNLDARISNLQSERSCVLAAQSMDTLKGCKEKGHENRKAAMEALKREMESKRPNQDKKQPQQPQNKH